MERKPRTQQKWSRTAEIYPAAQVTDIWNITFPLQIYYPLPSSLLSFPLHYKSKHAITFFYYYRFCLISNVFFKQNFIWNVFWQEIKLPFKVKVHQILWSWSIFQRGLLVSASSFWCEEFGETHFHSFNVFEISSTQEMGHGSKNMVIWRRKIRALCLLR